MPVLVCALFCVVECGREVQSSELPEIIEYSRRKEVPDVSLERWSAMLKRERIEEQIGRHGIYREVVQVLEACFSFACFANLASNCVHIRAVLAKQTGIMYKFRTSRASNTSS
jgi:hypothetical protein